jgi:glycosyltransferase involved in cell wall biosynthesis
LKRLLMVAYHFPPLAGSSGIQRTLRFVQHYRLRLEPLVLTAHPRAYERVGDDLMRTSLRTPFVRRAFALDSARHLTVRGATSPSRLARSVVTWRFDAVRVGMQMVREFQPDALWSTYPIATAHMIAAALQARTKLPWVADFRDPMAQDDYPSDPKTRACYERIEREAICAASQSVFVTPGAASLYKRRYPAREQNIHVLENGYDEESFASAERSDPHPAPIHEGITTLLHSGIVYPNERDPTALMSAMEALKNQGRIAATNLRLRFRAAVHDGLLRSLAARFGIADMIEILPAVGYGEALQEMRRADALLVMQASNCNEQIPAKVYEYLRAGKPILCLSDREGGHGAPAATRWHSSVCRPCVCRGDRGRHPGIRGERARGDVQPLPSPASSMQRRVGSARGNSRSF